MKNAELREKIKAEGLFFWQIAEALGVSDVTLRKWLRSEYDTSHQAAIQSALYKLKAGGDHNA